MKHLHLMLLCAAVGLLLLGSNDQQVVTADGLLSSFSPEKILKGIVKFPGFSGNGIGSSGGDSLSLDRLRKPLKKLGQAAKKAFKRIIPFEKKLRM